MNRLSATTTAVTVTVVLNIRKLASFLLSCALFGNELSGMMLAGASVVFVSGAVYGLGGSWGPSKKEKVEEKGTSGRKQDSNTARAGADKTLDDDMPTYVKVKSDRGEVRRYVNGTAGQADPSTNTSAHQEILSPITSEISTGAGEEGLDSSMPTYVRMKSSTGEVRRYVNGTVGPADAAASSNSNAAATATSTGARVLPNGTMVRRS